MAATVTVAASYTKSGDTTESAAAYRQLSRSPKPAVHPW